MRDGAARKARKVLTFGRYKRKEKQFWEQHKDWIMNSREQDFVQLDNSSSTAQTTGTDGSLRSALSVRTS